MTDSSTFEAAARRMFEWLAEVDRPAAAGHARYLRMLQARGLNRDQVLVMSYTRLFRSMDKYSAADARWGWEKGDGRSIRPATRLGFWPLPDYRLPAPPRHPKFRELVIYEGPFDCGAPFAWLVEVDRPEAVAEAPRFRDLLWEGPKQNDLVGTMYRMLYDLPLPYCGPDATWGWETAEPERSVPVARFGYWPLQDGRPPPRGDFAWMIKLMCPPGPEKRSPKAEGAKQCRQQHV